MKCISRNVRGLRNERRQGIVGHYLKEWGAAIVMLLETCDVPVWNVLCRGHLGGICGS